MVKDVGLQKMCTALETVDNIVLKKYVPMLSNAECSKLNSELATIGISENICLYHLSKIVYDKNENTQDKLTTVYSTIFSLTGYGLVMLINGHKDNVDLFLGVVSRNMQVRQSENSKNFLHLAPEERALRDSGKVLENAILANFPGTDLEPVNKLGRENEKGVYVPGQKEVIIESFKNARYVSAVSSIPAIRNSRESKNQEFVQGLEKLIETLKGKEYSAVIISDVMSNDKVESLCAGYEDLYTQLAPFKGSSQTLSVTISDSETKSFIEGVTNSTNELVSNSLSHGTAVSKTHTYSETSGNSYGISVKGLSFGHSSNDTVSDSTTSSVSKSSTVTRASGTAKSVTEQNSISNAFTETQGKSLQISYENRAVKTLLDRIDEQIARMRVCEDFGLFDTCAYFVSSKYDVVMAAASAFRSLTRGENSSVEASSVNAWTKKKDVDNIKEYLMRFYHPEFNVGFKYPTTPAMLISGKEMAYQMALPKKSVAGIAVLECAEFGREVVTLSENKGDILIGNIFHMHKEEENVGVKLDVKSLAAHTFITGSTGSGKSTAIYKLLEELNKTLIEGKNENIKFMVIEPAKGEYKHALAKNKKFDLRVYGTNPNITKLLKINPFRFPTDKIHIYEHLDKLTEIFNVCWPMYAAMPAVLKVAMENAYRTAGWDLVRSVNKYGNVFPSFTDVAIEVEKYINKSEYSEENKSNYKGSLLTRLESLTNGINSMIFSSDDIEDAELFDENVIVDLSRVGSMETKALIMGILILKMQEYRIASATSTNSDLRHVTVLEEAHNLLKRTSTEQSSETANLLGKAVEMLSNSIAEMRTYGEGFIIADQSPGLLDMSVIRNTNTKIILRLPDFSDRELVGKSAGLNNDQIVELSKLPQGVAAIYQNDWISPVLCKIKEPNLQKEIYCNPTSFVADNDEHLLFDLLDSKFRDKLDKQSAVEKFKSTIIKSSLATELKVKLLKFLAKKGTVGATRELASLLYNYFKNTKDVLESTTEAHDVEELKHIVMAELEPSVIEYDDEQIDLLILLIIHEYRNKYYIDWPIWNDFANSLSKVKVR